MRILLPLRGRSMALLWGGLSLSAIGDQLYAVALTWIAVGVLGSNAGYLTALQALIALLAVISIGVWADRWEQARAMIAADLASAAVLLAVVAQASATGRISVVGLACAIVVLSLGQAVFKPALQAVIPSVVDDMRLLPAANGLLDATQRIARLMGPGVVTLLVSVLPVIHFLTLDALTFLTSAAALSLIRRRRPAPPAPIREKLEPVWRGITRGYQATAKHPLLGYYLSVSGMLNGTWYAVFYLCLPLMIAQSWVEASGRSGLGAYGLILSAYGCGNLAATVLLGGRTLPARPQFLMLTGNILTGCGMLLLAAAANFLPMEWRLPGFACAAALGATGGPMQDIPTAVLRQTRIAASNRAAAMRAYMAMVCLGVLIAMALTPAAVALIGVTRLIVACGAVYLCVAALGLVRFAGWREAALEQSV